MRQLHVYYPKIGLFASYDIAGLSATALKAIRLLFETAGAWTYLGEDPRVTTIAHALREHRWALIENRENDGWPVVFVYDWRYKGLRSYTKFLPMPLLVFSCEETLDEIERGTTIYDGSENKEIYVVNRTKE
jgi:hypothetical protein